MNPSLQANEEERGMALERCLDCFDDGKQENSEEEDSSAYE
jgi:hypothetical protein